MDTVSVASATDMQILATSKLAYAWTAKTALQVTIASFASKATTAMPPEELPPIVSFAPVLYPSRPIISPPAAK